jgi:hypothetical protein
MPKLFTVQIEVPSGSRTAAFKDWLNKQLSPHRMKVAGVSWSEDEDKRHFEEDRNEKEETAIPR